MLALTRKVIQCIEVSLKNKGDEERGRIKMNKERIYNDLKTAEECLLDLLDCDPWLKDKEAGLKKVSREVLEESIKGHFGVCKTQRP